MFFGGGGRLFVTKLGGEEMESRTMIETLEKLGKLSTPDIRLQISKADRQRADLEYLIKRETMAIKRGHPVKRAGWLTDSNFQLKQLNIKVKELRRLLHERTTGDSKILKTDKASRFMRIAEAVLPANQYMEIKRMVTQEIASEKKFQRLETARQSALIGRTH